MTQADRMVSALSGIQNKSSTRSNRKRGHEVCCGGICVNFFLAATKCTAGILGHSFALIADGLESAAYVVTGLVVFIGLKIAVRPPDQNHPYGHGKAEPIAALIVGFPLIGAAIVIAVESIHGIITPHPSPVPYTLIPQMSRRGI